MKQPRYEIRPHLSQNDEQKFVLLYSIYDTLHSKRTTGWLRSIPDAEAVIRELEKRDRRIEAMQENKRTEIVKKIERLADDVFDLVCEKYCEYRHIEGEERRLEEHCKNCELKGYL